MLPLLAAILPQLTSLFGDVAKRVIPDPELAQKVEAELVKTVMQNGQQLQMAAADIIMTEAKSEHWLAAVWRPLVMLTFTALIVARWMGYSAPGLSEPEVLKLWSIVEFGLGGYVVGRSVEKIAPQVAAAVAGGRR